MSSQIFSLTNSIVSVGSGTNCASLSIRPIAYYAFFLNSFYGEKTWDDWPLDIEPPYLRQGFLPLFCTWIDIYAAFTLGL